MSDANFKNNFVYANDSVYSPKVKGIKGSFSDTLYSPRMMTDTIIFNSSGTIRKMYFTSPTSLTLQTSSFQLSSVGAFISAYYYNLASYPLRLYYNYSTDPTGARWLIINYDNSADTSMYENVSDTTIYINRKTKIKNEFYVDTTRGTTYLYSAVKKLIVDSIVSPTTSAWTSVKFQQVSTNGYRGDTMFVWPVGGDSTKILVKKSGIYSIDYNANFRNGSGSTINNVSVGFRVTKNSVEQPCLNEGIFRASFASGDGEMFSVSSTINCNANDTIRFQYYTTSSSVKFQTPLGVFDNNRGITFIIKEFK